MKRILILGLIISSLNAIEFEIKNNPKKASGRPIVEAQ